MQDPVSFVGKKLVHRAVGDRLNLQTGWKMMRDRGVSARYKLIAVGIGCVALAALLAVEFPVEIVVGGLVPILGFVGNFAVDGLEIVIAPLLIAIAVLPLLVPRQKVPVKMNRALPRNS